MIGEQCGDAASAENDPTQQGNPGEHLFLGFRRLLIVSDGSAGVSVSDAHVTQGTSTPSCSTSTNTARPRCQRYCFGAGGAELVAVDKRSADLADTIIAVGKSDVPTAKLCELEKRKRALVQEKTAAVPTIVTGGAEAWTEIVASLAQVGDKMTPDELEAAREIVHGYVGELSVVEKGDGVFGYTRLKSRAGYKSGAQSGHPSYIHSGSCLCERGGVKSHSGSSVDSR